MTARRPKSLPTPRNWLRSWWTTTARQPAPRALDRRTPHRPAFRPRVEGLEDRTAPAGDLDPTFGTGGLVVTDIPGSAADNPAAVFALANGQTLVVGTTTRPDDYNGANFKTDVALARYNPDGTLDTTFGTGGRVTTDFGFFGRVWAAALQPDGRLVAAGSTGNDFALARYNPDGTLDATFGTGGKVLTDFAGGYDAIYSVAVQADGRIVAAGESWSAATGLDFALARYNPDGTLDTTFGTGGRVTTDFAGWDDSIYRMALDSAGRIVVAGVSWQGDSRQRDFALARYNPNGTLDATFGTGGKVTTDFGGEYDHAGAIALLPDGRVITAGVGDSGAHWSVVAYTADSTLDTSFGTGGRVVTVFGPSHPAAPSAMAVQSDGRVVVAGTNQIALAHGLFQVGPVTVAVARYNLDGSLDPTFGTGGKVLTDFGGVENWLLHPRLAIRPDGRIVMAATSRQLDTADDFAVARYNPDGSLDTSFGTGGKVLTNFLFPADNIAASHPLTRQPDSKLLVLGTLFSANGRDFLLARYNPDGTLDTTFGAGGIVITDMLMDVNGTYDNWALAAAVQPDGRIVVAGTVFFPSIGDSAFALVRYNPDGTLDPTFGSGGVVTTPLGPGYDFPRSVAVQADGRIVAAGLTYRPATDNDFAVVRYNPDGSLDTSFGTGGIVVTDLGGGDDTWHDVLVQSDGRIVLAGWSRQPGTGADFAAVRYTAAWVLDPTFGSGGKVLVDFGGTDDFAYSLAAYPGGRIVVAGASDRSGRKGIALARINADGALDGSFGGGGRVLTDTGIGAWGVAVQSDGRIVVGAGPGAARYNPDGTPDSTFGVNGRVSVGFYGDVNGVVIQPDGRIVLGGAVSRPGTGSDFALARFLSDNVAPTASASNSGPIDEGGQVTVTVTASDPDGPSDQLTYEYDINNDGVYDFGPTTNNTHSITFADSGLHPVKVRVRDGNGGEVVISTTVTVHNVAPTVCAITAPLDPVAVGTPISAGACFTDPGVNDTHTATWDWGDGTTSAGTVTESGGTGSVTGSHTYATAGVYTVTLTVTDNQVGGSATAVFRYVVVYDAAAGFVTGGGWIDSPAGAYAAAPALTGRANFGFVSKYQPGNNVPTGNTEFQFRVADFTFKSTSYDWLVVGGARAQYKGAGTVNGSGGYKFLLTAIDGQQPGGGGADKFRIKIWDAATGAVVYDNQMGLDDNGDPTTALGGGSIKIHT